MISVLPIAAICTLAAASPSRTGGVSRPPLKTHSGLTNLRAASGIANRLRDRVMKVKASDSAPSEVPSSVAEVGGTAPMGKYWDPVGFTDVVRDPNQLKRFREAEITHGRLGMLGALGWLVQENFHPLFGGQIDGPAVDHFQKITSLYPSFWIPVLSAIAVAELGRARIGWKEPVGTKPGTTQTNLFELREDYQPGNIGLDPLGVMPKDAQAAIDIQNKELNNGRLAMLALAGFMAQELVNGKPILENLNEMLNGPTAA